MTEEVINKLNIYSDAFNRIRDVLNERDRRLFLAQIAVQAGFGAISILSQRTGVAISTIRIFKILYRCVMIGMFKALKALGSDFYSPTVWETFS